MRRGRSQQHSGEAEGSEHTCSAGPSTGCLRIPRGAGRRQQQSSGKPGRDGISVVPGERETAGAVPVSGESSLAARHGHGSPGTPQPNTSSALGTCKGTAAIRAEPGPPGRAPEPPGEHRE